MKSIRPFVAAIALALVAAGSCVAEEDPDFPDACVEVPDAVLVELLAEADAERHATTVVVRDVEVALHEADGARVVYRLTKEFDRATDRVTWIARRDGQPVPDFEARLEDARARYTKDSGRLHPALHELLEDRALDPAWIAAVPRVSVMIRVGGLSQPATPRPRGVTEAGRRVLAERAGAELRRQERDAALFVRGLIGEAEWMAGKPMQHGPFIRMTLPDQTITALRGIKRLRAWRDDGRGVLDRRPEDETDQAPTVAESLPLTRMDLVQHSGFFGEGVRIGILEPGYVSKKSRLAVVDQMTIVGDIDHLTHGCALIADRVDVSDSSTWVGFAPRAEIVLGNEGTRYDYMTQTQWALDQTTPVPPAATARRASVLAMSWHLDNEPSYGDLDARDEYFDYIANNWPHPTIVTAAGNQASGVTFASGKGYNFLGVGDVLNHLPPRGRCPVTISCSSTWRNPKKPGLNGDSDREVPEIAAPGSSYRLFDDDYHGGTSAATSVMAGIVATLQGVNKDLVHAPEGMRAILLASANDQSADRKMWSRTDDGKDGTGLVNAHYASLIAQSPWAGTPAYRGFALEFMKSSEFNEVGILIDPDTGDAKHWEIETCTVECRVRVALAFSSTTTGPDDAPGSVLDADLDLYVLGPDGAVTESRVSASFDGSNEFVEFRPVPTGTYTIQVRNGHLKPGADPASADGYVTNYAVAWTVEYDRCDP